MAVRFFDPRRVEREIGPALDEAIARVRASGFLILGPEVAAFEAEFAELCGTAHAIGVGNGTDALHLILRADGVGPGDEVLVPAYTAVATWMAVSAVGATPVGVDVDRETFNVSVDAAERAVGGQTRALIGVDLFGHPADWDGLAELAGRHGLLLYEDAAQAHGARWSGARAGSVARAAAFSFYPTKNLGALGDGGAVTTDDEALADRVRLLRTYGWRRRDASEVKGLNSRLDELQAAVLRVKLARLDAWNERRRDVARHYREALGSVEALGLPAVDPRAEPVWHQFVCVHDRRDALRDTLADRGVETLVHYDPLPHLTQAYRADGWAPGDLPVAEELAARALSLPIDPHLSEEEISEVVEAVYSGSAEPHSRPG